MSDSFPKSSYGVTAIRLKWDGTTKSLPVDLNGLTIVGFLNEDMAGTSVTFEVGYFAVDDIEPQDAGKMITDGTYFPTDVAALTVADGNAYKIAPADTAHIRFCKVISGSNEVADTSLGYLLVRPAS